MHPLVRRALPLLVVSVLGTSSVTVGAQQRVLAGRAAPTDDEEEGGKSAAPWVLTGFGVLMAGTGIGLYAAGSSKAREATDRPLPQNASPEVIGAAATRNVSDVTAGRAMQVTGVAIAAVGGAGVIGGLVWHFTEPTRRRSARLSPTAGPGFAGASFATPF